MQIKFLKGWQRQKRAYLNGLEAGLKAAVGICRGFVLNLGLAYNRHEVGIPVPAGHNMGVDVFVYTGTAHPSQIHTYIKAFRFVFIFKYGNRPADQTVMLVAFFFGKLLQSGSMAEGYNHKVPGVVRKSI